MSVEVKSDAQGVQSDNAEISQTISMEEINNLPILDRDALSVIQTQAGVVANEADKNVIGIRANSVPGVFSVENDLQAEGS